MPSFVTPNLLLNAAGFVLQQKRVAIYKHYTAKSNTAIWNMSATQIANEIFEFGEESQEVLTGSTIFQTSIIDVDIMQESKMMDHPVESGVKITDHKVKQPIEIRLRMAMPEYRYSPIYRELKALYDESPYLTILTNATVYPRMILTGIPHDEKASNYSRLIFNLTFREAIIIQPKYVAMTPERVKSGEDMDTVNTGINANVTQVG